MIYTQSLARGALLVAASEFVFVTTGALVKTASVELPLEVVVFFRNIIGLLVLVPFLKQMRLNETRGALRFHLLRAIAGLSAMYCFFYALANLPLATSLLLKQTAPLFIPVVAVLLLGESINRIAKFAIALGFLGVVVILNPTTAIHPAAIVGLLGGLLAAAAKVSIRKLSVTEPVLRTVFYFALIASAISAVPLLWSWQTPSPAMWWTLVAIGPVATLAQLLLTRAYSTAPAGLIGPFTYLAVLFAFVYGYVFWQEPIHLNTVIGAIIVALAGIIILLRGSASIRVIKPKEDPLEYTA